MSDEKLSDLVNDLDIRGTNKLLHSMHPIKLKVCKQFHRNPSNNLKVIAKTFSVSYRQTYKYTNTDRSNY